jgi:hypothetical protein
MAGDLESPGRRCQILGRDSLPRGRRGNNGRPKDLVDSGPKSAPKSPPLRPPSGRFLIDPPLPSSFARYDVRLAVTFLPDRANHNRRLSHQFFPFFVSIFGADPGGVRAPEAEEVDADRAPLWPFWSNAASKSDRPPKDRKMEIIRRKSIRSTHHRPFRAAVVLGRLPAATVAPGNRQTAQPKRRNWKVTTGACRGQANRVHPITRVRIRPVPATTARITCPPIHRGRPSPMRIAISAPKRTLPNTATSRAKRIIR